MLIGFVGTRRQLLLPERLALLQTIRLLADREGIKHIGEQLRRDIQQFVGIIRRREIDPVDVMRRSVHFATQLHGDAHLILQNRPSILPLEHRMTPLPGTPFQHQQAIPFRVRQQLGSRPLEILPIVQVETEGRTRQLVPLHHAVRIMAGVVELHQPTLGRFVAGTCQPQVALLRVRSTELTVFLLGGDGAGHLPTTHHLYQIATHRIENLNACLQLIVPDGIRRLKRLASNRLADIHLFILEHFECQLNRPVQRRTGAAVCQLDDQLVPPALLRLRHEVKRSVRHLLGHAGLPETRHTTRYGIVRLEHEEPVSVEVGRADDLHMITLGLHTDRLIPDYTDRLIPDYTHHLIRYLITLFHFLAHFNR